MEDTWLCSIVLPHTNQNARSIKFPPLLQQAANFSLRPMSDDIREKRTTQQYKQKTLKCT